MFQLCPAHRISIDDAILYPKMLVGDYEPNKCVDGSSHKASPVVVLDTVNTTLQIDNLNDNSEVSQAISRLREAFDNIPLITAMVQISFEVVIKAQPDNHNDQESSQKISSVRYPVSQNDADGSEKR